MSLKVGSNYHSIPSLPGNRGKIGHKFQYPSDSNINVKKIYQTSECHTQNPNRRGFQSYQLPEQQLYPGLHSQAISVSSIDLEESSSDISITAALKPSFKNEAKIFFSKQKSDTQSLNLSKFNNLEQLYDFIIPQKNRLLDADSRELGSLVTLDALRPSISSSSKKITNLKQFPIISNKSHSKANPETFKATTSKSIHFRSNGNNDTHSRSFQIQPDSPGISITEGRLNSSAYRAFHLENAELRARTRIHINKYLQGQRRSISKPSVKYNTHSKSIPQIEKLVDQSSPLPAIVVTSSDGVLSLEKATDIGDSKNRLLPVQEAAVLQKDSKFETTSSIERKLSIKSRIGSYSCSEDNDKALETEKKENVRACQGGDPVQEHVDFAGTRMPPPCDWEGDRPKFDNGFMHSYILEWRCCKDIPVGPTGFENNKFWLSGEFYVDNNSLKPALDHKISIPTAGETAELEAKRVNQTAHNTMLLVQAKCEKLMNNQKRLAKKILQAEKNIPETLRPELEVNPFSPKIAMYLRPAEERDSEQIAQIYNRHIAEGNITEDQLLISKDDTMRLINKNKNEKLPFIVAIAGEPSELVDSPNQSSQESHQGTVNTDKIIGFALSERYNYGFSGSVMGRSRYTSILQLFVAHDYQRQGVGRNLLDRLIHTLSTAYAYKKACKFVNPHGDRVNECEGSGLWHQVIFHVPVLRQDDPEFPRIKNFLSSRFLFKEIGRTKSTGRSNISRGPANWLDMVIFQLETSQAGSFDPFC